MFTNLPALMGGYVRRVLKRGERMNIGILVTLVGRELYVSCVAS